MIDKTAAGLWTCHDHPELLTADEEEAVRHLRAHHPDIVDIAGRADIIALPNRAARRSAGRLRSRPSR